MIKIRTQKKIKLLTYLFLISFLVSFPAEFLVPLALGQENSSPEEIKTLKRETIEQGTKNLKEDVSKKSFAPQRPSLDSNRQQTRQRHENIRNEARGARLNPTMQGTFRARETNKDPSRHPKLPPGMQRPGNPPPPPPPSQ